MKLVLLFLFTAAIAYEQVPVVSNYADFIVGITDGKPTALRIEDDDIQYGAMIHSEVYQEVLPLDGDHFLFMSEVFEAPLSSVDASSGEAYVCLCKKEDLVSILKRWKDGQKGLNDYASFDCKYRRINERKDIFNGDSFWTGVQPLEKIIALRANTESIELSQKINVLAFKNAHNPNKKILKVSYDSPLENVVKVIEDESYLISVKSDSGEELYAESHAANGWKGLFPEWKEYKKLNSGFWGAPKERKSFVNGKYSKSFVISPNPTDSYKVKGQTTFLIHKNIEKSQTIQHLPLNRENRVIKGDVYLDFGERLVYGVSGVADAEQKITVTFNSDIPISSITAFDVQSGQELAKTSQVPYEVSIPQSTSEINLKVVYADLKRVRVDYEY